MVFSAATLAGIVGLFGCATDSDSAAETDGEGSGGGANDSPVLPECEEPAVCGDGIVAPGEGCDDANTDDDDGCASDCRRPAPALVASLDFGSALRAMVDTDGSVIAVGDWPVSVARFSAEGEELWRTQLAPGVDSPRVVSLLLSDEIIVVGDTSGGAWAGTTWRFDAGGTPGAVENDAQGRSYGAGGLASDGGLVLMVSGPEDPSARIERRAPNGSVIWTHLVDAPADTALLAMTIPSDDVVFAAGGITGLGEAAIVRVTPNDASNTILSPPDFPNAFFYGIASTPDGGVVAVGDSGGFLVMARLDADGNVVWTSTCTAVGDALADLVFVEQERIVVGGRRWKPEPGCMDACSGAHWTWVQHFGLDGTVVATDAPEALRAEMDYPYESVVALGRDPSGSLTVLANAGGSESLLARFPW